jgi:inosine/xanthosine triphosphate pyrophosphatase family protein
MHRINIVTGNANKLAEYRQILSSVVELNNIKIDLPELQGDVMTIAK